MSRITYTGNQVDAFINGIKMDLLQTIRGADDYGLEPASGVGDIHVQEYVPTVARHTISISAFALKNEPTIQNRIIWENGDAALAGGEFDIEIFAKETGALLRKWTQAMCTNADVVVTAHRILVKDATFVALDVVGKLIHG
jgi:hypothetical protein